MRAGLPEGQALIESAREECEWQRRSSFAEIRRGVALQFVMVQRRAPLLGVATARRFLPPQQQQAVADSPRRGAAGGAGVCRCRVPCVWTPGLDVTDGGHDRGRNGIWVQHGWLGADEWFQRNRRPERIAAFRDPKSIEELATLLKHQHVTDVFPHVSPADAYGRLPPVDDRQTERFLDAFDGFRVVPWIGGVRGKTLRLSDAAWRRTFVRSAVDLLSNHPRLAGIHINIEPCPSGNTEFLQLLDELRRALPTGKLLSVAAYPPPTIWQPFLDVHWEESYFREVARRAHQLAVMMSDTGVPVGKLYQQLLKSWTREILDWSAGTPVLLGVPTYDDAGVGYHLPSVENLPNALLGIHAGLSRYRTLPDHYQSLPGPGNLLRVGDG